MKILYVAKHGCGDNNDELAIAYSLRSLGHEVDCVHELPKHRTLLDLPKLDSDRYDFCLFHKWQDPPKLRIPMVFWYFDKIEAHYGSTIDPWEIDPSLVARSQSRIDWMDRVIPKCLTGFCTDGDWAEKRGLVHLLQGADPRLGIITGTIEKKYDILFAGMVNHGMRRASHIAELQHYYGDKLHIVGDSGPRGRVHGAELAGLYAQAKVVIAPDGPQTDKYWSNRVYNVLGLGGFLLHPKCAGLDKQYNDVDFTRLPMYNSRTQCYSMLDIYLKKPDTVEYFRDLAYAHTHENHTYKHRCEDLVKAVQERL